MTDASRSRRKRIIRRFLLSVVVLTLVFLLTIWIFSPKITHYLLSDYLASQQISISPSSHVRFNPFLSQIRFQQLAFTKNNKPVLSLDKGLIDFHLLPLLLGELELNTVSISGLFIELEQTGEGVIIAGMKVGQLSKKPQSNDIPLIPLVVSINQFEIRDSNLQVQTLKAVHPVDINDLQLNNIHLNLDQKTAAANLNATFFGGSIDLQTEFAFDAKGNGVVISTTKLEEIDLEKADSYLPETLKHLSGRLSLEANSRLTLNNGALNLIVSDAEIRTRNLKLVDNHYELDSGLQQLKIRDLAMSFGDLLNKDLSVQSKGEKKVSVARFPLTMTVPQLILSKSDLRLKIDQVDETIQIDRLELQDLYLSPVQQKFSAMIQATLLGGPVNIRAEAEFKEFTKGTVTSKIVANSLKLDILKPYLPDTIDQIEGRLGVTSQLNLTMDQNVVGLSVNNTQIDTSDLKIKGDQFEFSGESQQIAFQTLSLELGSIDATTDTLSHSYTVKLPQFDLHRSELFLRMNGSEQTVLINSLTIKNLLLNNDQTKLDIQLQADLLEGSLNIRSQVELDNKVRGMIRSHLNADHLNLDLIKPLLPESIESLSGRLTSKGEVTITLQGKSTTFTSSDFLVQGRNTHFKNSFLDLSGQNQTIQVHRAKAAIIGSKLDHLSALGNAESTRFTIRNPESGDLIYRWQGLHINQVRFTYPDGKDSFMLKLEEGELKKVVKSVKSTATDSVPPLLAADRLYIQKVTIGPGYTTIGDSSIDGLSGTILIGPQKKLENLVWFTTAKENIPDSAKTDETEPHQAKENKKKPYHFSLTKVTTSDSGLIAVENRSVVPVDNRTFAIKKLVLSDLDNQSSNPARFEFKASSDRYTAINMKGEIHPFRDKLNLQVKGNIEELSLPSLMVYIGGAIGADIKSGQMDADFDVSVVESEINGKVDVTLRGLLLAKSKEPKPNAMGENKVVSINTALSLITDDQGKVSLTVPLKGQVDKPQFGLDGFVNLALQKAVTSSAKVYLLSTVFPYAHLFAITIGLGKELFKIRFEDLYYEPSVTDIHPSQQEFMDQFITLMKKKSDTQVKVCGIATPKDIGLVDITTIQDKKTINTLLQIAHQRAQRFKEYAVTHGELKSSRMLLCSPEIDITEKARPRIEIKI